MWKPGEEGGGTLQVFLGWLGKTLLMGRHLSETKRKGENYQSSLGRGNSQCKGPEAAKFLCVRNNKEAV